IRHCRATIGLSNKDINSLVDKVLFHPSFKLEDVSVRFAAQIDRYEQTIFRTEDGWDQYLIHVTEGDSGDRVMYHKDPLEALSSMFSSPSLKEDFQIAPSNGVHQGVYSTPNTGLWWLQMQNLINTQCPGAVVAQLIFYSDQTSLSNDGRVTGYPLVMSIANIACENRYLDEGHVLLAILPIISSTDASHERRLQIFHECLDVVLKPLKEASFKGLALTDPHGDEHWVFPLLYAYVCDHPEGCKVTCTYDTNQCQHPCSVCMCPKQSLREVGKKFDYRTEKGMQALVMKMLASTKKDVDLLSKENLVHPVKCALWGFNGGETEWGNPYKAIHVDMLHQADLG
ncbi:unnamed protein product, partial [Sphagnum compactum]